jgi:hypothetical protein
MNYWFEKRLTENDCLTDITVMGTTMCGLNDMSMQCIIYSTILMNWQFD